MYIYMPWFNDRKYAIVNVRIYTYTHAYTYIHLYTCIPTHKHLQYIHIFVYIIFYTHTHRVKNVGFTLDTLIPI